MIYMFIPLYTHVRVCAHAHKCAYVFTVCLGVCMVCLCVSENLVCMCAFNCNLISQNTLSLAFSLPLHPHACSLAYAYKKRALTCATEREGGGRRERDRKGEWNRQAEREGVTERRQARMTQKKRNRERESKREQERARESKRERERMRRDGERARGGRERARARTRVVACG